MEQKFCIKCGAVVDIDGLYCNDCFKERKKFYRQRNVQKRLQQGKCTSCGQTRDRKGWVCKQCATKVKEHSYKVTQERKEQGLCVRCATPIQESTYCQECRDKNTAYMRERRQKLRGS
jgi:predicted amidophosphoribosyltransferase